MKYSEKYIEEQLYELLDELLASGNQEGTIKEIKYNPKTKTCTVELNTVIVEEDNYIGFAGY